MKLTLLLLLLLATNLQATEKTQKFSLFPFVVPIS